MKTICVLGLGYIGLPTSSILATQGFQVKGVDTSASTVATINRGDIHIEEPGLQTLVKAAVKSGNLKAHTTPTQADVFIIAVPTPVTPDKKADLSCVQKATESIVPYLRPGNLVILESTSPPGTTAELVCPILETSGLKVGSDLYVAHCPERVLPGKIIQELIQNHRVIGGITPESAQKAKEIYETFVNGEIHLTDATTAEMVKIIENTYRDINIAFANEIAQLSHTMHINAWDVIRLANHHPRVHLHEPGPGVGGHCISVDPWFIIEKFPKQANLIRQARHINASMPKFTYEMLDKALQGIAHPKVVLLGVTYKPDVDDTRESPALALAEMIHENSNISLTIYDPHVSTYRHQGVPVKSLFQDADCILLAVNHTEFNQLDPKVLSALMRHKIVIDTRNALDKAHWERHGFEYRLLGHGQKLPYLPRPTIANMMEENLPILPLEKISEPTTPYGNPLRGYRNTHFQTPRRKHHGGIIRLRPHS